MNAVSKTVTRLIDLLTKREQGQGPAPADLSWLDNDDEPTHPSRPRQRGDASHLRVIKEE